MADFTFTEKQLELCKGLTDLQRRTVINMVKGDMTQRKAYYAGGGKAKNDKSADSAAQKMLSKVEVNAFYESLIEEAAGNAILTRDEALEILTDISRTKAKDIADFRKIEVIDKEGKSHYQTVWSFKDSDSISDKASRVISEVSVGKDGLKFKTHSQADAIKQLRALQGWDKTVEVDHKLTITIEGKDAEL